jgi:hypothetical protein
MIANDDYGEALKALSQVNFEGEAPWNSWDSKALDAIELMFHESGGTEGGDDDDRVDRQSNVPAGRKLFALSQSKANPFRFSRIKAMNGSYLPVIPIALLTTSMASEATAMVTHLRTHMLTAPPAAWPPLNGVHPMGDLWRMAPHQNWSGTLPERKVSNGEAQWYVGQRAAHAYAMNEWQVRRPTGQIACAFSGQLVSDPGAIRFVSVTGRRTLTARNISWVVHTGAIHEAGYKAKVEAPKGTAANPRFDAQGRPYEGNVKSISSANYRGVNNKNRVFGQPPNTKGNAPKTFTADLHDRRPIRFYFSLNHYRPIAFNVKSRTVSLNPWFAIVDY